MSDDVMTTLIGAATGLVIAVVTSFIIPFVQRRQEKGEHKRGIYEKYAQPLAADTVNLIWRLDEILFKKRGQYLREDAPRTPFNTYKVVSTCYRIAAVLGWIRAIRLEQSYLFYGDQSSVEDLRRSVVDLESALADAPHVEVRVLVNLTRLWRIELSDDTDTTARIAAQVAADMQGFLADHSLALYSDLKRLDEHEQLAAVRHIAHSITHMLGRPAVTETMLAQTRKQAIASVALKQAWIYRDWQQAIGDLMIREIDGAIRRFDILGYGEFETLFDDPANAWVQRLRAVVVGVDIQRPDPSDVRLDQLRAVARAAAALVCAIERLDLERNILDPKACELARKFLAELPQRVHPA
jgi:hypothetical protein